MSDWKKHHADEAEKALETKLVEDAIQTLMDNLHTESPLIRAGIGLVASTAAQVARAQALGFDPELLRLSSEEANAEVMAVAERAALAGTPVWVTDVPGA